MDIATQKDAFLEFLFALPSEVEEALASGGIDSIMRIHDIGGANGLILNEVWYLYEGVRQVFEGERSPEDLVDFISEDERIEEDNRPKIADIAYEIQTKVFDPVLPILKQAGFPIKEGRVPTPPPKPLPIASPYAEQTGTGVQVSGVKTLHVNNAPTSAPVTETVPSAGGNEKNMQALLRIAAGTTYNEQQLREAFEALPSGLRQSLSSVDTANTIQEIAKKYVLHIDQMASLASETGLVLLGLTHPADFIGNLTRRLRTPESQAREIARDISAQILAKVRDGLRGLHEEKPAYENTNSANIRMTTNKTAEPLQKINVMPQQGHTEYPRSPLQGKSPVGKGMSYVENSRVAEPPNSELKANSYKIKADIQTPYSEGAKWNTGENILKRQAETEPKSETSTGDEAGLNRADMLRDIENPKPLYGNPSSTAELATGRGTDSAIQKSTQVRSTTNGAGREVVGPTGWKPSASPSYETTNSANIRMATNQRESPPSVAPVQQRPTPAMPVLMPKSPVSPLPQRPQMSSSPTVPVPSFLPEKSRPIDTVPTFTPPKPKAEPQDFLNQKLKNPLTLPHEEKRYTSDPYREPLQ